MIHIENREVTTSGAVKDLVTEAVLAVSTVCERFQEAGVIDAGRTFATIVSISAADLLQQGYVIDLEAAAAELRVADKIELKGGLL